LIAGNALVSAGTYLAILIGTIVGGLLILQPGGVEIISVLIVFFALLGWLASLKIPNAGSSIRRYPLILILFGQRIGL
jgi:hypothetical protein